MPKSQTLADEFGADYVRHYNRGRQASLRGSELDAADWRGEPDAWYNGYADVAAGRAKWHLPRCKVHHNGPGGCGEA